jgi:PKD repeat protein
LRNQSLAAQKFRWDFDGNGTADATTSEQEVTTVYKQKGTYVTKLSILLSDGNVRNASVVIHIPNAIFDINPQKPIVNETVRFDATNLVSDPKKLENILWDFNGDGTTDKAGLDLSVTYAFTEIADYQAKVTVQHQGGLQEEYTRPISVLAKREQPFTAKITTEGDATGTAPLGVIFIAKVQEGVQVRDIQWTFSQDTKSALAHSGDQATGERVSHIFPQAGTFIVTLRVFDMQSRVSENTMNITVLEPLTLRDIIFSGTPRPANNVIEGKAPLEVQVSATTNTPLISFHWEQESATRVYSVKDSYHATYEKEGTYPLVAIAQDADGRMQTFTLEVRVLPPTSRVIFSALPPTGIAPLTVKFDASQSFVPDERITGFAWLFGDEDPRAEAKLLGANVSHRYEKEGTYVVTVRALTESGKSFEAKKTIVVREPTLDACVFPSRTIGDAPMGVRFNAGCSTGKITSYTWDFGDGATSAQETPEQDHVFQKAGTYTVQLEVSDGEGGLSQTTVDITVR